MPKNLLDVDNFPCSLDPTTPDSIKFGDERLQFVGGQDGTNRRIGREFV